jgi:chemotaxis protein methyltransferase CheR
VQLTQREFKAFRDIVYKGCGIHLHEGKRELLTARLSKRLRVVQLKRASQYLDLIKKDQNEFVNFIDAISTNHTFFFRENHHFEFLLKNVDNANCLKIWSAACSSGEEPYSMAIQLLDRRYRFDVVASDISNKMIFLAKRGIYHKDKVRLVPLNMLRKYFQKGHGQWDGYVRVKNEVRKHIDFGRHNLLTDDCPEKFNIILCRNVMIYFDDKTKQKVINKLYRSLEDGGFFVLGAAEGLVGIEHQFKYLEPSIYRK